MIARGPSDCVVYIAALRERDFAAPRGPVLKKLLVALAFLAPVIFTFVVDPPRVVFTGNAVLFSGTEVERASRVHIRRRVGGQPSTRRWARYVQGDDSRSRWTRGAPHWRCAQRGQCQERRLEAAAHGCTKSDGSVRGSPGAIARAVQPPHRRAWLGGPG